LNIHCTVDIQSINRAIQEGCVNRQVVDTLPQGLAQRLIDSGLEPKDAQVIIELSNLMPLKASEIGNRIGISRMDAYTTLKRLQNRGLVHATVEKPMRFTGKPISEIFELLILQQTEELLLLKEHLEDIGSGKNIAYISGKKEIEAKEPSFTVVKGRQNIHATISQISSDAESEIWLLLGRWGILHLTRSGSLEMINQAAERGVAVRVIAVVTQRTLKYFSELNSLIEIRHSEKMDIQGVIVDDDVAVQSITIDANPVGRGRDDSALIVEAPDFISAQKDLVRNNWATAINFQAVTTRIENGKIVEPLHVSLGSGSFYQRLKQFLATPLTGKNPSSIGWTNAILRTGDDLVSSAKKPSTFEALGVDTNELLRSIGRRIGEEIVLEVESTKSEDFWSELTNHWRDLGMGELIVVGEPVEYVRVENSGSCGGAPNTGGIFCHLDEGILEGIIQSKFGLEVTAVERECTATGENHCHFDIIMGVQ